MFTRTPGFPRTPGRSAASSLVVSFAAFFLVVSAPAATAQTDFVPYYGKNQIRYDSFKWQIYTTDHF